MTSRRRAPVSPGSQSGAKRGEPQSRRNVERMIGGMIGVAVLTLGVIAVVRAVNRPTVDLSSSVADNARDHFSDLFLAAWRRDQGTGNVLVEAVYYHGALQQALQGYDQKSPAQRELVDRLKKTEEAGPILPITLLISAADPDAVDAYDFAAQVSLTDGDQTYAVSSVIRLDPLNYLSIGVTRAYLIAFAKGADATPPKALTLRIADLGTTGIREFYWDSATVLGTE